MRDPVITSIVVIDKLTYAGSKANLPDGVSGKSVEFQHVGIESPDVHACLREFQPQRIVNLAAETHVDRSIDGPGAFLRANVDATFAFLETVREYWGGLADPERESFRFLQVSTDEVYGSVGAEEYSTECSPLKPSSPYSASKASADHFVQAFGRTYGLPVLVARCSNCFGPRQLPEKFIPLVTLNALEQRELPVYGDGSNIREWLFVDDAAKGLASVLKKGVPGEIYNLGSGNQLTNLEVVKAICGLVDSLSASSRTGGGSTTSELIRFVPDRPGHDQRYALDSTKARTRLGWAASCSFLSSLRNTIEWYQGNKQWLAAVGEHRKRKGMLP